MSYRIVTTTPASTTRLPPPLFQNGKHCFTCNCLFKERPVAIVKPFQPTPPADVQDVVGGAGGEDVDAAERSRSPATPTDFFLLYSPRSPSTSPPPHLLRSPSSELYYPNSNSLNSLEYSPPTSPPVSHPPRLCRIPSRSSPDEQTPSNPTPSTSFEYPPMSPSVSPPPHPYHQSSPIFISDESNSSMISPIRYFGYYRHPKHQSSPPQPTSPNTSPPSPSEHITSLPQPGTSGTSHISLKRRRCWLTSSDESEDDT